MNSNASTHIPNANMADHSVIAQDKLHESEVSQSSTICFENASPENSCFIVDMFHFISVLFRVAVFLNGRFQKISIPIPRTAFWISEGEGGFTIMEF